MHNSVFRLVALAILVLAFSASGCSSCKKGSKVDVKDSTEDAAAQLEGKEEAPAVEDDEPEEQLKNIIQLTITGGDLKQPVELTGETTGLNYSNWEQGLNLSGLGETGKGLGLVGFNKARLDKITIQLHNKEAGLYVLTEEDRLSFFFDRTQDGRRVQYASGWALVPGSTVRIIPDTTSKFKDKGELQFEGDVQLLPPRELTPPLHVQGSIQTAGRGVK